MSGGRISIFHKKSEGRTLLRITAIAIAVILALVVSADIVTMFFPAAGLFGLGVWLSAYTVLAGSAIFLLFGLLRRRNLITAGVLFILSVGLLYIAFLPYRAHHETTQQAACVLARLRYPDMGFHDWCFLGYPVRQYYLSIVPSLLLGRSTVALNLGNSLYVLLGMFWFAAGLTFLYRDRPLLGDLIVALALSSLLHLGHLQELLFNFEQTLVPLSHALLLSGIFCAWHATGKRNYFFLMLLAGYLTPFTYTPSLALIPLLLLLLLFWKPAAPSSVGLGARLCGVAYVVTGGVFAIVQRNDVKLWAGNNRADLIEKAQQALLCITGPDGLVLVNLPGLALPAIAAILCLLGIGRYLNASLRGERPACSVALADCVWTLCCAGWVAIVILASALSHGYANPALPFSLHRAMPVLPVVLTAAVIIVANLWRFKSRYLVGLVGVLVLVAGSGFLTYSSATNSLLPELKVAVLRAISGYTVSRSVPDRSLGTDPLAPLTLCFDRSLEQPFGNLGDFAQYFSSKRIVYNFALDCRSQAASELPADCNVVVISAQTGRCVCPALKGSVRFKTALTTSAESICVGETA